LIQVDGSFPNLALMKLSAFHKRKGDDIFFNFPLQEADITYISKVFTWSKNLNLNLPNAVYGGIGINPEARLPEKVEHIMPDYSLYNLDFSMGYTSRGCPRKCPWCKIPSVWGEVKYWASIYEFWNKRHHKILLLDDNLLASPNWKETLSDLAKEKLLVDFNQGLDIRLADDEKAYYLSRVRTKILRFSFDHLSYERQVREGIKTLRRYMPHKRLSFYVLVGFDGTTAEDALERMKILGGYGGIEVYPMVYRDDGGREPRLRGKLDGYWFSLHRSRGNFGRFLRVIGWFGMG